MAARRPGKSLLLVGPYFEGENEEAGRLRALEVGRQLPGLNAGDLVVSARMAGDCQACKEEPLHGLRYKWVTRNDEVIEYLEHTHVLYEYDSSVEVSSPAVTAYFDELAELLQVTGDRVILTGHTDNTGEPAYNTRLGMERALEFRDHLISLGVDPAHIQVTSLGETEPLASNENEEGRRLNRRVEIRIIEP
jgi:outer membrane protein OmpA-like peptidoglycan-associated protein